MDLTDKQKKEILEAMPDDDLCRIYTNCRKCFLSSERFDDLSCGNAFNLVKKQLQEELSKKEKSSKCDGCELEDKIAESKCLHCLRNSLVKDEFVKKKKIVKKEVGGFYLEGLKIFIHAIDKPNYIFHKEAVPAKIIYEVEE